MLTEPEIIVRTTGFKARLRDLLPRTHPVRVLVDRLPDRVPAREFAAKAEEWLELLDTELDRPVVARRLTTEESNANGPTG